MSRIPPETSPYSVTPDWLLRGGYAALCVYRTDTQESMVTSCVRPVGFQEDIQTRVLADGTLDEVRRVVAVSPEVVSWPMLTTLRRWRQDAAQVRAVLVSARKGPHLLFDEPVPVILTRFNDGRGTLAGDRLLLHSSKYSADVEHSPDLLGTDLGAVRSQNRVLPIPGLTVYGIGGSVQALDRTGTVLASAASNAALVLPSDTWSVQGADLSALVTRDPGASTFALSIYSDGSATSLDGGEVVAYSGSES